MIFSRGTPAQEFFNSPVGAFVGFFIVLGITLIIYKLLDLNKYVSLLFLGKRIR